MQQEWEKNALVRIEAIMVHDGETKPARRVES